MPWGIDPVVVKWPAIPGDAGTAYLWDSTCHPGQAPGATSGLTTLYRRLAYPEHLRAKVSIYVTAQNVTFYAAWLNQTTSTWRVTNGGGAGEVVTAGTWFHRDLDIFGHDFKAYIVAGATAPTLWEGSLIIHGNPQAGI